MISERGRRKRTDIRIEMGRIQDFLRKLEKTMAAAAFAEAGEPDSARDLLHDLKNAHKKVLLGTDHMEPDLKIVNYALSLCRRMGAGLEIFHVLPASVCGRQMAKAAPVSVDPVLLEFNRKMESLGVVYQPVCSDRGLAREIVDYVAERRHVLCVVVSPSHAGETSGNRRRGRTLTEWFQGLGCPVLFYGNQQKA
jgi:nucleotide-binding universal stress UspA family protein